MDWKEQIDKQLEEVIIKQPSGWIFNELVKDIQDFIQTEIIKKLIEEIPEIYHRYKNSGSGLTKTDYIKQQLKAKWLN